VKFRLFLNARNSGLHSSFNYIVDDGFTFRLDMHSDGTGLSANMFFRELSGGENE